MVRIEGLGGRCSKRFEVEKRLFETRVLMIDDAKGTGRDLWARLVVFRECRMEVGRAGVGVVLYWQGWDDVPLGPPDERLPRPLRTFE